MKDGNQLLATSSFQYASGGVLKAFFELSIWNPGPLSLYLPLSITPCSSAVPQDSEMELSTSDHWHLEPRLMETMTI